VLESTEAGPLQKVTGLGGVRSMRQLQGEKFEKPPFIRRLFLVFAAFYGNFGEIGASK